MTAADFTKEELFRILEWAYEAADKAKRGKLVNGYAYETAKAISDKVFKEYCEREG